MPDHRLEGFGMSRHGTGIDGRHNDAGIGRFTGIAAIPADNANYFSSYLFGIFQSPHQINTNIFFLITTADGKNKDPVFIIEMAAF